jgi:hypothetical protein
MEKTEPPVKGNERMMKKKHLNEGQLQAYLDGELIERQEAAAHLAGCLHCQDLLSAMQTRNALVAVSMERLKPDSFAPDTWKAYSRLVENILSTQTKENKIMKRIFAPRYRTGWVIGVMALLIAVAMAFAPVRTWANNFLSLFRVEQVTVIEVDPVQLAAQMENASVDLESLLSTNLTFEGSKETIQVASADEAAVKAGFPIRLPSAAGGSPELEVVMGGKMTFDIDLPRIQALLQAIGRQDLVLPKALDGATVTLTIPPVVNARWGDCRFDMEAARQEGYDPDNPRTFPTPDCSSLIQMPSPTIVAPPGVDINQLGEIYLQLLGMSQEEASDYAANIDWTSTFVLPLPRYDVSYRTVNVDGVEGTLIQDVRSSPHDEYAMIIWIKDGILYALSGPGDVVSALEAGNSMK